MNDKLVAIDLTWVRHKKVGGTESCVRNLLDGFAEIQTNGICFVLLLTKDNAESFEMYEKIECFKIIVCDVNSISQRKRVLFQNFKMGKLLRENGIKWCLVPVYGKPFMKTWGVKYITTIHDLQALHYPQYFSKGRVAWMKASWLNAVKTSEVVITISQYVKDDIAFNYMVNEDKIHVIYDAVKLEKENCADESGLSKFGLKTGEYYYTVSSLFLHKNLRTLVLALDELKKRNSKAFYPLVVSGIGGRKRDELDNLIKEKNLQNDIIFTPFVEDQERNMLYKNCRAFLFSSIFEGFGMPPIEAMAMGVPVLTTRCTSLEEVTGGLLNYVEEPMNPKMWADNLEGELKMPTDTDVECLIQKYDVKEIAAQYVELLDELMKE